MQVNPLVGKSALAVQHSTARINAYEGSVRSGKTIATLIDWIRFVRNGPPGNLLMTGRTERTVINNLVLEIQAMLGPSRVKINRGNGTVDICGRTVFIVGANNEAARTKIQGLTLAGAYVDEASTLPESFWSMLISRLSVEGAQLWSTCNPEGPQHWFKTKWLDRAKLWIDHNSQIVDRTDEFNALPDGDPERPIDLHRFSFTLEDNRHNLDPKYYDDVMNMYTGLWYQRMILGYWSIAEGSVWDAYDPDTHVVNDLPEMRRVVALGIDYGTTNPSSGIMLGVGVDDRLYAFAEWAPEKGSTDAALSRSLQTWMLNRPEPEYLFIDSAAASFKLQLHHDGVPRVFNAIKDVTAGVRMVNSLFSINRLFVHESCKNLIREIPGYVWDAKKSEQGEDAVVAINDHFCDALRYSVFSSRQLWEPFLPEVMPS